VALGVGVLNFVHMLKKENNFDILCTVHVNSI
jgi:hypothetical protein